jgi:hypothetical protein
VKVLLQIGDGETRFIEADLDRLEQITTHRPVIGAVHPGTHVDVHAAVPRLSDYDGSLGIFQNTLIGIDYRLDDVTRLTDVVGSCRIFTAGSNSTFNSRS